MGFLCGALGVMRKFCRCWYGLSWMTFAMYFCMMYLGIVVLGSSTFNMSEAIVCVIVFGRIFGEQKGCFVSCVHASWTMVGTRGASGGMVGSWDE